MLTDSLTLPNPKIVSEGGYAAEKRHRIAAAVSLFGS